MPRSTCGWFSDARLVWRLIERHLGPLGPRDSGLVDRALALTQGSAQMSVLAPEGVFNESLEALGLVDDRFCVQGGV